MNQLKLKLTRQIYELPKKDPADANFFVSRQPWTAQKLLSSSSKFWRIYRNFVFTIHCLHSSIHSLCCSEWAIEGSKVDLWSYELIPIWNHFELIHWSRGGKLSEPGEFVPSFFWGGRWSATNYYYVLIQKTIWNKLHHDRSTCKRAMISAMQSTNTTQNLIQSRCFRLILSIVELFH